MTCDSCREDVSSVSQLGLNIIELEEGGRVPLTICDDCFSDIGDRAYCYECGEFYDTSDIEGWPNIAGTIGMPCPEHSVSDERPIAPCVTCGARDDITTMMWNAYGSAYCVNCWPERVRCSAGYCGVRWHPDDPRYRDGEGLCPDCIDMRIPSMVNGEIGHPMQWEVERDCLCRMCANLRGANWPPNSIQLEGEPTSSCMSCGYQYPDSSGRVISGEWLCHTCVVGLTVECERCRIVLIDSDDGIHQNLNTMDWWCEDCADEEEMWYCGVQCNAYFDMGESCNCGGVHSYRYRPNEFTFFTAPDENEDRGRVPFFGIELEVEDPNRQLDRRRGARLLNDFDWAYPVHDGSLAGTSGSQGDGTGGEYGLEIVTHPFSWKWFNNHWATMKDMLKRYADIGWRSWEGDRCAMHVHLSREPMTEAHQLRFVNFIYGSVNLCLAVGQRGYKSRGLKEYASFTGEDRSRLISKIRNNTNPGVRDHYAALNTQYSASMEARWFRGTLNPLSFRKNLEFMRSAFYFTDRYGHQSANEANYISWLFSSPQRSEYKVLADYLKANYLKRGHK